MPNQTVLHRPLNKLYPLEIRSHDEAVEKSIAQTSKTQPRPRQGDSIEVRRAQQETPSQAPRRNQERASKTRAYEVIQGYERQLDSSSPTSINCPMWTLQ
uniref:Uncharacterized protein n=1 Tax=Haemonchus contortus TaxID=6289 RepID=A0A7I4YYC0_HAECO